jgi:hypothetical protein
MPGEQSDREMEQSSLMIPKIDIWRAANLIL